FSAPPGHRRTHPPSCYPPVHRPQRDPPAGTHHPPAGSFLWLLSLGISDAAIDNQYPTRRSLLSFPHLRSRPSAHPATVPALLVCRRIESPPLEKQKGGPIMDHLLITYVE